MSKRYDTVIFDLFSTLVDNVTDAVYQIFLRETDKVLDIDRKKISNCVWMMNAPPRCANPPHCLEEKSAASTRLQSHQPLSNGNLQAQTTTDSRSPRHRVANRRLLSPPCRGNAM